MHNLNLNRLENLSFNWFLRSSLQRNTEDESRDNIIMQANITDSFNLNIHKHIFFCCKWISDWKD